MYVPRLLRLIIFAVLVKLFLFHWQNANRFAEETSTKTIFHALQELLVLKSL